MLVVREVRSKSKGKSHFLFSKYIKNKIHGCLQQSLPATAAIEITLAGLSETNKMKSSSPQLPVTHAKPLKMHNFNIVEQVSHEKFNTVELLSHRAKLSFIPD